MLLMMLAASAALAKCPVERARYASRTDASVTIAVHSVPITRDWPNGIVLALHVGQTDRTYWWLPWNGGTDGRTHVRATSKRGGDPKMPSDNFVAGRDTDFLTTDADYNFAGAVPQAGRRAPAHLLLPWIPGQLGHATTDEKRDVVPLAFFDLVGCVSKAEPADVILPDVA